MSRQQRETVDRMLRDAPFDLGGDVLTQRPLLDRMLTAQPLPEDVVVTPGELGGVPVVFIDIADTEPEGVLFHVHGGGFALGSARGSVGLAAALARRAGMRAVAVDYRLAPEHPYPAAPDDVMAAYRALLEREGGSERIAFSGESAGGNLVAATLVALAEPLVNGRAGLPLPVAGVLFSPMTDLTVSGNSFTGKAEVDPSISARAIRNRVADYLGGHDPADPRLSPAFADLTGLPPLLIQAGSHEVLLDDAVLLAGRAAADNVAVTLDITPEMPHVFQAFSGLLDEGDAALTRAAAFLRTHLHGTGG